MNIGKYWFDLNLEPIIMGILNVTPDSFSDGGKHCDVSSALKHTEKMISEGAKIIDVGGESTRPGYKLVSSQEETERVIPVIEAIKKNFDVAVSLDTYKGKVAEAGISAGCDMINDIWGLKVSENLVKRDKDFAAENMTAGEENALLGRKIYPDNANVRLAKAVAKSSVSICIMHNRDNMDYGHMMRDVKSDLRESIKIAHKAGIQDSKIIIDPGIGFGKDYLQNLFMIKHVNRLCRMGYPVLFGTSRKSVIGYALDADKDERVMGTAATTVMGLERGCRIFRVHDVKENYQAMMMAEKVKRA